MKAGSSGVGLHPEDASENDCCICLLPIECNELWASVDSCSHGFHAVCVERWSCIENVCPCCRRAFHAYIVHDVSGPVFDVSVSDCKQRRSEDGDEALGWALAGEPPSEGGARPRSRSLRQQRRWLRPVVSID